MADALCPTTLAAILQKLLPRVGLSPTQFDVGRCASISVLGFTISQRGPLASAIQDLLSSYQVDCCEVDGKLVFVPRGGDPMGTIAEGDLGAQLWRGGAAATGANGERQPSGFPERKRLQDLELPFQVDLTYFSVATNYQQATQSAKEITKQHLQDALTINTPLTLEDKTAALMAEQELYRLWVEREQFTFSLPPRYLKYAPTDVLTLPVGSNSFRIRIVQVDIPLFGPLAFSAVLDSPDLLHQEAVAGEMPAPLYPGIVTDSTFIAWAGNALRDEDALDGLGFYAAAAPNETGQWPGIVLYWSRDNGQSWQVLDSLHNQAVVGTADTLLSAFDTTGYWDMTNTLDVTLPVGELLSTSDAEVLNGANTALVGSEYLQFVTATALSTTPNRYRLSRLLRGRRGTDGHWTEHRAGERFALLDAAWVKRETVPDDLVGKAVLLKPVMVGDDLVATPSLPLTITGEEFKPYAPSQIVGMKATNGDFLVSWVRRTRAGGELKDFVDADLAEATESYDVCVQRGTVAVHTFSNLPVPSLTYTVAQQTADFGAQQDHVTMVFFQNGRYGRGYPATAIIPTGFASPPVGEGVVDFSHSVNSALLPALGF